MTIEEILKAKYGATSSYMAPVHLNERSSYLKDIIDIINSERVGTKFSQIVSDKQKQLFAIKLSHIPTEDLPYVISVGKDYKNRHGSFSKYLYGSLKVRENSVY